LHRNEGLTLVTVTHEENVACAADQVLTLDEGHLVEGINK
jgi:predicted ABC-type transport system involved in lysophospholipase L1 biosynthesis ATPase subunit